MFVDQVKVHIKAGKGGDGLVSFRHEKYHGIIQKNIFEG